MTDSSGAPKGLLTCNFNGYFVAAGEAPNGDLFIGGKGAFLVYP